MDKLYYISQGNTEEEQLTNITKVCKAGVKLVQLRMKGIATAQYEATALKAKKVCDDYHAKLIINDSVAIALKSNADGVHLGKGDMNIKTAREKLGSDKIIGGTANTINDCYEIIAQGANYIGLGPYKFTETKTNLSPVLGLEGYKKIYEALQKEKRNLPVYAIGGITKEDFSMLLNTGIHGIAVSGMLTNKTLEVLTSIVHGFEQMQLKN